MKNLSKHYDTLTAHERLLLTLEAAARWDWGEMDHLAETCPKFQYGAQRDLAFTGKRENLLVTALLHAALFFQTRGRMIAAYALNHLIRHAEFKVDYPAIRAELIALNRAWEKFCDYAGFDPEIVMQAFGFELDPMLDDFPGGPEPSEETIDEIFQQYQKNFR